MMKKVQFSASSAPKIWSFRSIQTRLFWSQGPPFWSRSPQTTSGMYQRLFGGTPQNFWSFRYPPNLQKISFYCIFKKEFSKNLEFQVRQFSRNFPKKVQKFFKFPKKSKNFLIFLNFEKNYHFCIQISAKSSY